MMNIEVFKENFLEAVEKQYKTNYNNSPENVERVKNTARRFVTERCDEAILLYAIDFYGVEMIAKAFLRRLDGDGTFETDLQPATKFGKYALTKLTSVSEAMRLPYIQREW